MKKLLFLILVILLLGVSCEFDPPQPTHITIEIKKMPSNIYWQMIKDGGVDTGEYRPYLTNDMIIHNVEPGSGYTLKFFRVGNSVIENESGALIEKKLIDSTYETHFVIDHYITEISVTYTKEEGLGCNICQSWLLN